ncbi:ABC transporter permease [Anaerosporobacter faecicola]|uniref:ABC transporter permease n=1 Tax=Anaerosporobacter faecicola TaxID=2718714 RepID=UPI001439FBED|nr:ABC transporter permease [Anaerosporobacter faecicola]
MQSRGFSLKLLQYELRNTLGNVFILVFGILFPIIMSILTVKVFLQGVPEQMMEETKAGVFITMSLVIPMATVLIGYAATYSQELEKKIPFRIQMFGYSHRTLLLVKMISYLIVMTISLILFTIVDYTVLDIPVPTLKAAGVLILSLYLLVCILFIMAHGIALYFKKFGPTYAITMAFYFGIMILCGMFGVMPSQLPKGLRFIAYLFPMSYISEDFAGFWKGGTYNFVPYIQSMLFLTAVSCLILYLALRKNRRVG